MSTLPPIERMAAIVENRQMHQEINQIRAKQQTLAQKLELLQEDAFRVIEELAVAQGIVKQVVQESVEKLKSPITTQTTEGILTQEAQAKEKAVTTKETFQKFIVMWKGVEKKD
jgi:hypothetical protein